MDAPAPQKYLAQSLIVAALLGAAIFLFPGSARAASLFIAPAAENVSVGQTFTVNVDVSSADEAMNAASGDISFPSDKLQVLSVSKAKSVMNLWIRDPSFTNSVEGGDVHFEGVVLNPGFIGATGNLITITFQAVATGDAPLTFSSGAVLANDGNGTNILSGMQPGDVTIGPRIAGTTPALPTGPPGSGSQTTPATEPSIGPLFLKEVTSQDPTNPQPIFTWGVTGAVLRGITYEVKIGNGDWFDASTILVPNTTDQYQLPLQAPTQSTNLTVAAYDPAGDSTSSTISFSIVPIPSPSITDFSRTVPSTHQLFSIEGSAPSGTTVQVYLKQSSSLLVYAAKTDDNGHWSMAAAASLTPGTWDIYAQAVDARGDVSEMTPVYQMKVNSWLDDFFPQILGWGIATLTIILLLGGIIFLALNIVHLIRKWRVASDRDVIELEARLRRDLDRIEKELDKKKK